MSAAWFIDGAYLMKCWNGLHRQDSLDFAKLRSYLEQTYCDQPAGERIEEAYYFNADPEPPTARQNAFHNALAYPPPGGPGLRVKIYWLNKKLLNWPAALGGGPVVHPQSGQQFELVQQKGVDVGLAFHLVRSYARRGWKKLLLAAGDGDFYEVIQSFVEGENVPVWLIGSMGSISEELRPYATGIVQLDQIAAQVSRARPAAAGA